jgi:protein tyrosine phosphatase type IVA
MSLDTVLPVLTPKASATAQLDKIKGPTKQGKTRPPRTPLILASGRSKVGNSNMAAPKNTLRGGNSPRTTSTTRGAANTMSMCLGTKPTLIEKGQLRFWITDAPRQSNMHLYVKEMLKNNVKFLCRFCEPTYREDDLVSAGIGLQDMEYKDGTSPPKELIKIWLELVFRTFYRKSSSFSEVDNVDEKPAIAVHCVAGLGRGPVMVAIALIEFGGMDASDAVGFIRSKRRGAINEKQRVFLEDYKKVYKMNNSATEQCCVIL